MNGYSKMRVGTNLTSKSRSMDFQGLSFSPPQENSHPNSKAPQEGKTHEEDGERFGVILKRTCSSASQRFTGDEKSHGRGNTLQAVVRRAFSMRKPSSVGDGYWRIHDTGDGEVVQEGEEEEEEGEKEEEMRPSRRKRGGIFRACKHLFKF